MRICKLCGKPLVSCPGCGDRLYCPQCGRCFNQGHRRTRCRRRLDGSLAQERSQSTTREGKYSVNEC